MITSKPLLIIINTDNPIKWHHLDNNATFKKLKYIYSGSTFDCNQLDLYIKTFSIINLLMVYQLSSILSNYLQKKENIVLDNIVAMELKI